MDYFMVGDDGVVVIAPEPTSVENAYAFMRAAFYRRLQLAMLSQRGAHGWSRSRWTSATSAASARRSICCARSQMLDAEEAPASST